MTAASVPTRERRLAHDVRRLAVLLAALVVFAVALWVPLLWSSPLGSLSAGTATWRGALLALAFIVLEGAQAHIEVRRQTFSITLSEAPLVVGLALTPPLVLLLAHALAMVVAEVQHRVVGVKAAVNIALVTIESGVALTLFRALHVGQITHPGAWPAVYLAILVTNAVSAVLVALAITLTQGRPSRRDLALFLPAVHHRRAAADLSGPARRHRVARRADRGRVARARGTPRAADLSGVRRPVTPPHDAERGQCVRPAGRRGVRRRRARQLAAARRHPPAGRRQRGAVASGSTAGRPPVAALHQ